jgi:hypothetical protein
MEKNYDVIVVGGGPGGVCAAIAAAGKGLSTLLIEKYGFCGGMATAGLVNPFMCYKSEKRNLANSVFRDIIKRLGDCGGVDERGYVFDDEMLKIVLDEMLQEAGVDLLFHSTLCGAECVDGTVKSINVVAKNGIKNLSAKIFIDGTGDGDLAFHSGFKYEMGREEDGACQPSTLSFRLGGVRNVPDLQTLRNDLTEVYLAGKESGEISDPRENALVFKTLQSDVIHFNTTRVIGKDSVTSEGLTDSELIARKQVKELVNLFKRKSPYCKDSYLIKMAAQIGVRETRRIMGGYVLREEEVVKAAVFDDGIARSNYPVDIHSPTGAGTVIKRVEGEFYEIPYRCLVPENSKNLLMACRAISSTHGAHSSLRVMPVVASFGEAAGLAAAKALESSVDVGNVNGKELKEEIFAGDAS